MVLVPSLTFSGKIKDFGFWPIFGTLISQHFWIVGLQVANQGGSTRSKNNKAIPAILLVGIRPWFDGPEIPGQQPMLQKKPPNSGGLVL